MKNSNPEDERGAERGHGRGGPHGHRGGRGRGGHGGGRGPGFGRSGGWQQADLPPATDAEAWLAGRLPTDWFTGPATVQVDREEIAVRGELPAPEVPDGADEAAIHAAALGRIAQFREQTREVRMQIADEAEARYSRKIAWGASIGPAKVLFTHLAVPVMTRLRQDERRVLDTLVDSGVARSRSEALSWCVKLVGEHAEDWIGSLRQAMSDVDELRAAGPDL